MAIKRYYLTKDNTLTNAFKSNLQTRATGSNMGASDILETFVIHGQTSASISATNAEQSRVIIEFDMEDVLSDISDGTVPSSSVDYVLKMHNAPHASTTPLSYSLDVSMVKTNAWNEGRGLDMDNYSDQGVSNWIFASSGEDWDLPGGDYYGVGSNSDPTNLFSSSYFFDNGDEDLELNINFAVDKWRTNKTTYPNYGLILKHTDPIISGSSGTYFTKKFFGRTSEFFLKRPYVEARWNSCRKDNRGNFVVSSSMIPSSDNVNILYLYNMPRGQLTNIPGLVNNTLSVKIFSGSTGPQGDALRLVDGLTGGNGLFLTGGLLVENGNVQTGIYTCSIASALTGATASEVFATESYFDVWYTGSTEFHTGSFTPQSFAASEVLFNTQYITTITNLDDSYIKGQKPDLRVFTRKKDWAPTIYTVASQDIEPEIIEDAYYRVFRTVDGGDIIPFGTGSIAVAASAKITILDAGGIIQGETFTLTDAEGTTTVYTINGGVLPANGGGSGGTATVGFSGVGGGAAGKVRAADAITKAINNTTDATYIATDNQIDTVTITQATTGTDGNRKHFRKRHS